MKFEYFQTPLEREGHLYGMHECIRSLQEVADLHLSDAALYDGIQKIIREGVQFKGTALNWAPHPTEEEFQKWVIIDHTMGLEDGGELTIRVSGRRFQFPGGPEEAFVGPIGQLDEEYGDGHDGDEGLIEILRQYPGEDSKEVIYSYFS